MTISGQKHSSKAILSIAGSDPSGGAGIQADLKTFTAIGVYGAAAITCLTVQNTRGVRSFAPLHPELVSEQITAVLDDMEVSHIKTGMIGTPAIAESIGAALSDFGGEIICDPVILASSGDPLFQGEELDILETGLLAKATAITPNLPELEVLSGLRCGNQDDITAATHKLLNEFPRLRVVLVSGGHLKEKAPEVTDFLFRRGHGAVTASHPRIDTKNTHGTGCTLASAFSTYHLLTGDDTEAFQLAVSFMDQLLQKSAFIRTGHGKGPLHHHLFRSKSSAAPHLHTVGTTGIDGL